MDAFKKIYTVNEKGSEGENIYINPMVNFKHLEFTMAIKNLHSFGWECEQTFLQFKHQYIYIYMVKINIITPKKWANE